MHIYMKLPIHSKGVTDVGMLEKIFGSKFEDVLVNSRKLHKEEHNNIFNR
jgi:hypothetical protein